MSRQHRVLVVESDLDVLYYVDDLLRELGCRPIKVTSVEDAADIVGAIQLDAVVIDLGMIAHAEPATLEQLAASTTPVLVMTERGLRPEGEISPLRCFVEHPPDLATLANALDACLRISSARLIR